LPPFSLYWIHISEQAAGIKMMNEDLFKKMDFELREILSKIISKIEQVHYGILDEMTEEEKKSFLSSLLNSARGVYDSINHSIVNKAREMDELKRSVEYFAEALNAEKERSEKILASILPSEVIDELKYHDKVTPRKIDDAIIIFIDIVGFTRMSSEISPDQLLNQLDYFFTRLDQIGKKYQIERIKLIGDCYMCGSGITNDNRNLKFAVNYCLEVLKELENDSAFKWQVKIGINQGAVIAGIAGNERYHFDIWGDAVNVASRYESTSLPGKINTGEEIYQKIKNDFQCESRGNIEIKNKGVFPMYFINGIRK
jgi:class 3 adenylate cyclase